MLIDTNQDVTTDELAKIRSLADFDLVMLISEIHDYGWLAARTTLQMMPPSPNEDEFAKRLTERPSKLERRNG